MTKRSSLFGRRVHIAGSISNDPAVAKPEDVSVARAFVAGLTQELVKRGANLVIPVDAEKVRKADDLPICFDWLQWQTLNDVLSIRPKASRPPAAIAVQHHKSEHQIPEDMAALWDALRLSPEVEIENVSHWNMNAKRMEAQARWGDILITLGGGEGVLFLANLYHDAGKPVIPLDFQICGEHDGSRRLFRLGLSSQESSRLFKTRTRSTHSWINRINFSERTATGERVSIMMDLLEDLQRPRAFGVRLLNPAHADYQSVETYFDQTVRPFIEDELGYQLVVIDGLQAYEYARVDQEIFEKLHRSSLVVADITGSRPNCFLELGYALACGLKTLVLAKQGVKHPFDIETFAAHHWVPSALPEKQRDDLAKHWRAVENRPPIVGTSPLIA